MAEPEIWFAKVAQEWRVSDWQGDVCLCTGDEATAKAHYDKLTLMGPPESWVRLSMPVAAADRMTIARVIEAKARLTAHLPAMANSNDEPLPGHDLPDVADVPTYFFHTREGWRVEGPVRSGGPFASWAETLAWWQGA